jgi:hypothetical protein
VPAAQPVHWLAPEPDDEPGEHSWHEEARVPGAKVPAEQGVQDVEPVAAKLPALQLTHPAPVASPVTLEAVPAGQAGQKLDPGLTWNVPGAHSVHAASPEAA